MIDKLKLWNYLTLHHSMLQYRQAENWEMDELYSFRLSEVWHRTLSIDDCLWIYSHMENGYDGWEQSIELTEELIELAKDIGKPVKVFERLTVQLSLF